MNDRISLQHRPETVPHIGQLKDVMLIRLDLE